MAKSLTDPKDDEQKTKFMDWLNEWFDAKMEVLKEEQKKNPKGSKGFWDLFE